MKTLTLTAKFQLLPTSEQAAILSRTMQTYSNACNFISEHIFNTHDLSQRSLHDALYYKIRDKFNTPAQMTQSMIRTVIARYKTIRQNQNQWIQPDFKQPQCDLVFKNDYSFKNQLASVNSLNGRLKMPVVTTGMDQFLDGSWKLGTAKLVYKYQKWFLHIPMSKPVETLEDANVTNIVGVDLGINFLAVTYDSQGKSCFFSGKQAKQKRGHYKVLRKELQEKQTSSARRKIRKTGQRENRWMSDLNHQITKALVESAPKGTMFVLEDLTGIRHVTERVRRKDRYVQVSWAFYDFRQKLEYKALKYGHKVLIVDPRYTSQTCPKCGHTEKANRNKRKHVFKCKNCNYQSNDDRIGAMNLYLKGLTYLSTGAQ